MPAKRSSAIGGADFAVAGCGRATGFSNAGIGSTAEGVAGGERGVSGSTSRIARCHSVASLLLRTRLGIVDQNNV
jgi:hypothetical protein